MLLRDAREPLAEWGPVRLLLTDTPGHVEERVLLDALIAWAPLMAHDGVMVVHTHIPEPKDTRALWRDHGAYYARTPTELISEYTRPGDLVADPFCGSSVTGIYALRVGRRWLGTDTDPVKVAESIEGLTADASHEESRWNV